MRSLLSRVALSTVVSASSIPETTRRRVILPTSAVVVLKTKADMGSATSAERSSASPLASVPCQAGRVSGEGKLLTMRSINGWMPMLRVAEPQSTGMRVPSVMAVARPLLISSSVSSPSSRYFSMSSSSVEAMPSISSSRAAPASSAMLAGTSPSVTVRPSSSKA